MIEVTVIDGQGGGIGKSIVERIRSFFGSDVKIIALGTNTYAANVMKKAGADFSYCGELAICHYVKNAKIITGTLGIIAAGSMMGELTAPIANAVSGSDAVKFLIPLNRCSLMVTGVQNITISEHITNIIDMINNLNNS